MKCDGFKIKKCRNLYLFFIIGSIVITMKSIYFPTERVEWIVVKDDQNQVIGLAIPSQKEEQKIDYDAFPLNLEDINNTRELNLSQF